LQVTNGERQVASAANATKPEVDLYGTYEGRGVVIPGLTAIGGDPLTGNALVDPVPAGGSRSSTIYEAAIQFFLLVQNRVARGNLGAPAAATVAGDSIGSAGDNYGEKRNRSVKRGEKCSRCSHNSSRVADKAACCGSRELYLRIYNQYLRDRTGDLSDAGTTHGSSG